jgi:DinB superfamily
MPTKYTPQERDAMIARIRQLPSLLEEAVQGLTVEQLTTHYLPSEWTVAQNVHHVADAHMIVFVRLKLILTEERPPLKSLETDAWAALGEAGSPTIDTSLQLLRGLHARWADLFQSLNEEQWQRTGMRANGNEVTVEDLLRIYAGHGESHITQIKNTLAAK